MQREAILETPRMSLWFIPDDRIVFHQMHQYPGKETLETILLRGLDLLRESGGGKWLSDDRAGGALPKAHHDWGDRVWAPQAMAAGWKYWALLPPKEALGNSNMTRLVETYARRGVVVEIFSDLNKAHQWLRRQGTDSASSEPSSPDSDRPGSVTKPAWSGAAMTNE